MRSQEMIAAHVADDVAEPHQFLYRGRRCHQPRTVFAALDELLGAAGGDLPATIVELGTTFGAFTQVLLDHDLSAAADVHSFDINDYGGLRDERATFHLHVDVFGAGREVVEELVGRAGRTYLFCDNGNKPREIGLFAPALKPGDVLLGHDYARTAEERSPIWGWEFVYADVEEHLSRDFEPHCEAALQRAAWGCWIRR